MSVLESQPSLSISTNECKQRFLMNEIESMKVTKEIYHTIFEELRTLLREVSVEDSGEEMAEKDISEKKLQNQCIMEGEHHSQILPQPQQSLTTRLTSFTNKLSQTVTSYCSSSLTPNIIKYLQIQNQQHQLHPTIIRYYNTYIKSNQKTLAQRQKQLQMIQDAKYARDHGNKQLIENVAKEYLKNHGMEKDRRETEKTISSFDYHRKLMDVVKKDIAVLKLKRKKLILQIDEINKIKEEKQTPKQKSQNLNQLKKTNQKFSGLKILNLEGQETLKPKPNYKDDTSGLEKIVMVYQKQKFLNTRIQDQIFKLQQKILNQRQQNKLIQQKTSQLYKQIEKLQWTKVCESSFAPFHHKKFEKPLQLSILDRTFLRACDENSIEYSIMSINQSIIKKI